MAYERKDYSGTRASTTLSSLIDSSATSIGIASATGWPAGTNGKFFAVIDPETASEEKILVTTRTGTTLNTVTRGVDGTSAAAHDSGATIYPCFTATDADEANYAVAETVGKVTTSGDLLVADGANSLDRLAKGANSRVFAVSSAGALGYAQVTNAMLAGMTRGSVKVGDASGVASDLALGAASTVLTSDGTDAAWAAPAGEGFTIVRKTADESVTSSTTFQVDDHLVFTAANGTPYAFNYVLVFASPAGAGTPDLKIAFGEDATTTRGLWTATHPYLNTAESGTGPGFTQATSNTADQQFGTGTAKRVIRGGGYHLGAGGTFALNWAQNTSNANAVTIYAGSYITYKALT